MGPGLPAETLRGSLLEYCRRHYAVSPVYPWEKLPFYAVLKHGSGKWFALFMNLPRTKLSLPSGPDTAPVVDTVTVRCDPARTAELHTEAGICPAYHMNRNNWVTVLLDGTAPEERVQKLLDDSFFITEDAGSAGRKSGTGDRNSTDLFFPETGATFFKNRKDEAVRYTEGYRDEKIPVRKSPAAGRYSKSPVRSVLPSGTGSRPQPALSSPVPVQKNLSAENLSAEKLPAEPPRHLHQELTPFLRELRLMGELGLSAPQFSSDRAYSLFCREARAAAEYEDTYKYDAPVRRYYPTYSSLTDRELRGYFGWRTRFRQGNPDPELQGTYVYLLSYEILCGVSKSPESGLSALMQLDLMYRDQIRLLHQNMAAWIRDYVVYHGLDPEMAKDYVDLEEGRDMGILRDFLSAEAEKEGAEDSTAGITGERAEDSSNRENDRKTRKELFEALLRLSPYPLEKIPYRKRDPEGTEEVYLMVLGELARDFRRAGRITFMEFCFGRRDALICPLFRSAVFFDYKAYQDYVYDLTPVARYRCRNGVWTLETYRDSGMGKSMLRAVLREIDRQLRLQFAVGKGLLKSSTDSRLEALISDAVSRFRQKKEAEEAARRKAKEAERKRQHAAGRNGTGSAPKAGDGEFKETKPAEITIDMSLLEQIRRDAAITRDSLLAEEEEMETEASIVPVIPASYERTSSGKTGAEIDIEKDSRNTSENDPEKQPAVHIENIPENHADNDPERIFLKALLSGGDWKNELRERHLSVSMLADRINETMMDELGDTVIEFDGDTPVVIEDYREDLAAFYHLEAAPG